MLSSVSVTSKSSAPGVAESGETLRMPANRRRCSSGSAQRRRPSSRRRRFLARDLAEREKSCLNRVFAFIVLFLSHVPISSLSINDRSAAFCLIVCPRTTNETPATRSTGNARNTFLSGGAGGGPTGDIARGSAAAKRGLRRTQAAQGSASLHAMSPLSRRSDEKLYTPMPLHGVRQQGLLARL